ncbi:hypothetical protein BDP27DRAFT_1406953 [Rhodocollybia butyracea]|uniref:Uncharacterized protein n=1 Tax=Rhodocollybia butyracea TaxID=206335 RepID=A0A9P5PCF8_9AGAR|nr:hypothetical protein BDP27DRAFT_1406953 [Rhodocollybia butyracea]
MCAVIMSKISIPTKTYIPKLPRHKSWKWLKRLFAGKGVLVKHSNEFYYPGRLIYWDKNAKHGSVEMWRGIQNDLAGTIIEKIPVKNIVDGLWMDEKGRQKFNLLFIAWILHTATPGTCGLLDTELAAINARVHTQFPKSAEMDHLKMLHNSIAHARTLLVAHKFHSELAADADNLHLKAWED